MRKPQSYDEFQNEVFQEIESKRNSTEFKERMEAYGLTWNDVMSVYVEGMTRQQVYDAMWNAKKRIPPLTQD